MKKIISIILAFTLLILPSAVFASAEDFNSNVSGFSNVEFANGYYGFCIDAELKGAKAGDVFTSADSTDVATNNNDSSNVSQKLKLLLVLHFEELFIPDGNGGYVVDSLKASSSVQTAVWNITDNRYNYGDGKRYVENINAYDGPEIPDEGYTLALSTGETVVFSFAVAEPPRDDQQSFFCYKVVVADNESSHKHDYSDEWSSDDENHWHECECNDKADLDEHTPSDATCINPSICTVCNEQLSGANSENHAGETYTLNAKAATEFEAGYTGDIYCSDCDTMIEKGEEIPATHKHDYSDEWSSDDKNHWHECECNNKADLDEHTPSDATCINPSICTVCNEQLSGANSENHAGETYTLNAKAATEFEAGYTGDIYCSDCDTMIEKGEEIPATHKHDYSDEWSSDDKNHWHECECNDKTDNAAHTFEDGVCTVCGKKSASNNNTPSIDLDSILGALPEIDLGGIIDAIIGIIGGIDFDGGNSNNNGNNNNGNNVDTEIPDTGSDASIAFAFVIAAISLVSLFYIRKKKVCAE